VQTKYQNRDTDRVLENVASGDDPAAAYLAQLGPGSRRTMREAVSKLARLASSGRYTADTLPWHELRIEQTTALRTKLASELAPATANKHLAALRGVLKQCWRLGSISGDDYQRAIALPAVHGASPRHHRTLSTQELLGLVGACENDRSPAGARDAALFALLFGGGLRRSEVVALDLSDFDRETGTVELKATASRPQRRLTLNRESRRAVEHWTRERGFQEGPLFNPINKGGRIEVRRLSEQAIYIACHKRAAEAGLPPVSPEDLRRSLHASKPGGMRRVSSQSGAIAAQSA
jgi:integrase